MYYLYLLGRPPKNFFAPKTEPFETNEELESYKVNEENKVVDGTKTDKLIEIVNETDTDKETETDQTIEIVKSAVEEIEVTETKLGKTQVTEEVDATKTFEESESIEENTTDVIFTVPAPVVTTIRVIEIPRKLKERIAFDHLMITKHNKVSIN